MEELESRLAHLEEENRVLSRRFEEAQKIIYENERSSREGSRRMKGEAEDLRLLLIDSESERVALMNQVERFRPADVLIL